MHREQMEIPKGLAAVVTVLIMILVLERDMNYFMENQKQTLELLYSKM